MHARSVIGRRLNLRLSFFFITRSTLCDSSSRDVSKSQDQYRRHSVTMGLFTATTPNIPATRRLKRRSLGKSNKTIITPSVAAVEPSPASSAGIGPLSKENLTSSEQENISTTAQQDSDQDSEFELVDLQSDTTFLYERHLPLDSPLGSHPLHSNELSILEQIDAHVAKHYLDCYGISHHDEIVHHHNRLIPFFAKAPRFLSIHSVKQKELERDYTDAPDTSQTCPRQQLCQGRCLLGLPCPLPDSSSASLGPPTQQAAGTTT